MFNKKNEKKKDKKVVSVDNLKSMSDVMAEDKIKQDVADEQNNDNVADEQNNGNVADEQNKNTAAVGIVNCDKLRVRKGPSTDAEILKFLEKGDEVVIESEDNEDFYKIATGFVMKKFIDLKL